MKIAIVGAGIIGTYRFYINNIQKMMPNKYELKALCIFNKITCRCNVCSAFM